MSNQSVVCDARAPRTHSPTASGAHSVIELKSSALLFSARSFFLRSFFSVISLQRFTLTLALARQPTHRHMKLNTYSGAIRHTVNAMACAVCNDAPAMRHVGVDTFGCIYMGIGIVSSPTSIWLNIECNKMNDVSLWAMENALRLQQQQRNICAVARPKTTRHWKIL